MATSSIDISDLPAPTDISDLPVPAANDPSASGPITFKNQPATGVIRNTAGTIAPTIAPGSVEAPSVPAWRQYLEEQAAHPEQGGLVGSVARGAGELLTHAIVPIPGAIAAGVGNVASTVGSTYDLPWIREAGDIAQKAGNWWAQHTTPEPTTALGRLPAAAGEAAGKVLDVAGSGYEQMAQLAGAPRVGAVLHSAVSNLPAIAGAAEAAGAARGGTLLARPNEAVPPAVPAGEAPEFVPPPRVTPAPMINMQAEAPTQAAAERVSQSASPQDQAALARIAEGESLPHPIKFTLGQATGDLAQLSDEFNRRGEFPQIADRFKDQDTALKQNMTTLKSMAAPDVTANGPVEMGQGVIDSYLRKDAPIVDDIRSKYAALEAANGGSLPMDGADMVSNVDAALKAKMKGAYLPPGIANDLSAFRNGGAMTLEDFENLRTNIAGELRKATRSGDGNAAYALNITRSALENTPISNAASAQVKALADTARSAAADRFNALRADPAYQAAVDGADPAGYFNKYVINGTPRTLAQMSSNLDDLGQQHVAAGVMDHLSRQAGADRGTFSQAGFNRALYNPANGIAWKMDSIFDPQIAQHVESLAGAARTSQFMPRGNWANRSNTTVAALRNWATRGVEGIVNYHAGGIPVGTIARAGAEHLRGKSFVNKALNPTDSLGR
jgi:hypothetical protein